MGSLASRVTHDAHYLSVARGGPGTISRRVSGFHARGEGRTLFTSLSEALRFFCEDRVSSERTAWTRRILTEGVGGPSSPDMTARMFYQAVSTREQDANTRRATYPNELVGGGCERLVSYDIVSQGCRTDRAGPGSGSEAAGSHRKRKLGN